MHVLENPDAEGSRAATGSASIPPSLKRAFITLLASMGIASAPLAEAKPAPSVKATAATSKPSGHKKAATSKRDTKHSGSAGKAARTAGAPDAAPTASAPDDNDAAAAQNGVGSWYGRQFHGKQTASGELFNMNMFTAAHRTLPIPSYARVSNLDNGREVIVRVNDRGPYVGRRVIDLSMAAAQKLDIHGLGRVRIEPVRSEDILSGKWREEEIRPSGPSESGEASVATVASVKTAKNAAVKQGIEAPSASRKPLAEALPGTSTADAAATAPTPDTSASMPTTVEGVTTAAVGPRPIDESMASAAAALDHPDRADAVEVAGSTPAVKHALRVRSPAPSATTPAGAGTKDSKDAKDSAVTASVLVSAHPLPTPLSPLTVADFSAPLAASRASAPAPAISPTAAAQAGTAPGSIATLPAPTPVWAAASAVAPVAVAATPPREVNEASVSAPAAAAAAAPATSILANVAANVVTPVLSGIARSASDLKDTVVNFALSRPAQKPGAVLIDPARTSSGRGWWLQLGVFEQSASAMSFQHKVVTLAPWLAPLMGVFDERGEQKLQAGPYPNREQAQQALERAREALKVNPVMVQRR